MDIIQVNDNRILKALRRIKSRFSGDSHESVQVAPFGDDSCPQKGIKGIKTRTSTDAVHVILGYFNKNNIAEAGEKRIFSVQEDGLESVYVYLKNTGTFEIGTSDGFKMTYDLVNKRLSVNKDVFYETTGISLANHTHTAPGGVTGTPIPTI
jgi:hypothetical protein